MNKAAPGLWLGLGLALLAAPVLAADLASRLFARPSTPAQAHKELRAAMPDLGQVQVLRGRFTQRKILRDIPGALTSTGEFLLVRDRGIWWHTQMPLDSELTLTPAGAPRSQAAPPQPGMDLAATMFLALLTLDFDTLARRFDLFLLPPVAPDNQWQLGLRPRDSALAAGFGRAMMAGGERLEQVTLFEAAGDRTEIRITATAQPLSGLTPAERQRFGP